MEMYISEWVDAEGRRHVLYMPLSLDELPLGDSSSLALDIVVEEGVSPQLPASRAPINQPSLFQRILGWLCAPLGYNVCPSLDSKD